MAYDAWARITILYFSFSLANQTTWVWVARLAVVHETLEYTVHEAEGAGAYLRYNFYARLFMLPWFQIYKRADIMMS